MPVGLEIRAAAVDDFKKITAGKKGSRLVLDILERFQEFTFVDAGQGAPPLGKTGEANQGKQLQASRKPLAAPLGPFADAGHLPPLQGVEGDQQVAFTVGGLVDNQALIANNWHGTSEVYVAGSLNRWLVCIYIEWLVPYP